MAQQGYRTGRILKRMKENIDRPLAAILTLNTVAHTVGAAGVGAQAAVVFGDVAVGIATAAMTLAILVLSEIIPKTLGAVHARALAPFTAFATRAMVVVFLPLIVVLERINRRVGYQREKDSITRLEVQGTIRLGRKSGSLAPTQACFF
jgi:Mg2+/Co2+ transporter CorB